LISRIGFYSQKVNGRKEQIMFLTAKDIQRLCPTGTDADMVSKPFYFTHEAWEKRMGFIEANRFDITVESIWLPDPEDGGGFLGVDSRQTPKLLPFPKYRENEWLLTQGFYHILAGEKFNMPNDVFGTVKSRRTVFGFSSFVVGTDIAPGYDGQIYCGLVVMAPKPYPVKRGARFSSVRFGKFTSEGTIPYEGIWGGKKLSTNGIERAF
jgi:deoxycytidine triphosphate deaminase